MPLVPTRSFVFGFTESEVRSGLPDLLAEFQERPWIIRPSASWDAERGRLVITRHYDGEDVDYMGRAASDEVWDWVIACVDFSSEGIQFELEESALVKDGDRAA